MVRLVVRVKLLRTPEQAAALEATLDAVNRAANLVAKIAFQQRCFRNFDLRKHAYDRIKAEPPSPARRAASLSTPTSTQPATSPHAVRRAGQ